MRRNTRKRNRTTDENHAENSINTSETQNEVQLVQDDDVAVRLGAAYLGSVIVDIRTLLRNSRNRIIDHAFIKKLQESFQLGARRYSQEDRLKVTTSASMFREVLQNHTNDLVSGEELTNQVLRKTSVPVGTSFSPWLDQY